MSNVFITSPHLTYIVCINIVCCFLINVAQEEKKMPLHPFPFSLAKQPFSPLATSLDTVITGFCNFVFLSVSQRWQFFVPFPFPFEKNGLFLAPVACSFYLLQCQHSQLSPGSLEPKGSKKHNCYLVNSSLQSSTCSCPSTPHILLFRTSSLFT